MFRSEFEDIRLAKDYTIKLPDAYVEQIGADKVAIYGAINNEKRLGAIPLKWLAKTEAMMEEMMEPAICYGHYSLRRNNRLYIPEKAREYAGIKTTDGVVVAGALYYFELWSQEEWIRYCDYFETLTADQLQLEGALRDLFERLRSEKDKKTMRT